MMHHPNNQASHSKQRAQSNPKAQGNTAIMASGADPNGQ